jgi:hypothetical protein
LIKENIKRDIIVVMVITRDRWKMENKMGLGEMFIINGFMKGNLRMEGEMDMAGWLMMIEVIILEIGRMVKNIENLRSLTLTELLKEKEYGKEVNSMSEIFKCFKNKSKLN